DPTLFYGSTHQSPLYPGTGAASDTGVGNIVNLPLRPMSGSAEFRRAVERELLPALDRFAPELLLISAGFDAHRRDPLAQLQLDEADYAWVTERLVELARAHAQGRVVSTLEGGYDLQALGASAAAHVLALMSAWDERPDRTARDSGDGLRGCPRRARSDRAPARRRPGPARRR